jgi:2-methylisocitrate lyase-like PEP mutase family enzyme
MPAQIDRAAAFHALHVKGRPIVLYNIWDAGSAQAVARAGAKAIATGSWSVAAAHGFADGECIPLDSAVANLREIVAAVQLPVTLDLEAGYGSAPGAVAATVTKAIQAGAIGCNLEDQIIGADGLYPVAEQAGRVRAARAAADRAGIPFFINARTDLFLKAPPDNHDAALASAALARARAYAEAGASGFFAAGLIDESLIARVCAECSLPVNILVRSNAPSGKRLAALGVARISYGPGPYRAAIKSIEDAARLATASVEG